MRAPIQLLLLFAALGAAAPVAAELYKWVDERGVTNYSSEPPPAAAPANKLARVDNKISVYTPDASLLQAVKALRERSVAALTEPERERNPVVRIGPPQQSTYEACVDSGRVGCEDLYSSYLYNNNYPGYWPGVAVWPGRGVRPTRYLPPRATPLRSSAAGGTRGMPPR